MSYDATETRTPSERNLKRRLKRRILTAMKIRYPKASIPDRCHGGGRMTLQEIRQRAKDAVDVSVADSKGNRDIKFFFERLEIRFVEVIRFIRAKNLEDAAQLCEQLSAEILADGGLLSSGLLDEAARRIRALKEE